MATENGQYHPDDEWEDRGMIYTQDEIDRMNEGFCDALLSRIESSYAGGDIDSYESRVRLEISRMENGYYDD